MSSHSDDSGAGATAPEPQSSSSRSRLRFAAIVIGGLVLLCLVTEGLLRVFYYTPSRKQIYTEYGWIQEPGSEVISSGEGYGRTRLNSMGFYDDEVLAERPPIRAVLLGDSYSQAMQVARRQSFASVLEQDVPGLEVINTGQAGLDPIHYAAYLAPLYELFEPDLVIVQVNDGDIGNIRDSGDMDMDPEEAIRRFLERDPQAIRKRGLTRPAQWLAQHSALATFIYRRLTILGQSEKARLLGKFTVRHDDVAADDTTGVVDPRIGTLMDGFLAHMRQVTGNIIYVYIPHVIYSRDGCEPKFPERRAFYHEFARRNDVVLVDAFDAFCREFEATGQPVHGFNNSRMGGGHINASGHRIVGDLLAQAVRGMMERTEAEADSAR
jgi:hypothetical protein